MAQIERVITRAGNKTTSDAAEPRASRNSQSHRDQPARLTEDAARRVALDTDHLEKHRIILGYQNPAAKAAYKMLRTRVLQRMRSNQWTTLAITSATQENGKSLTALNLAISMATEQRQKVVLVDLDLRNPDIHSLLGLGESPQFANYMDEMCKAQDILVRPEGLSNLFVVPNSQAFEYSSELLASARMTELINDLRSIGDERIIIFDMPPLTVDDVLAFMPNIDAVLMVVAERETRREDLLDASELLEDYNVIGTVLNMSNEKTSAYY